MLSAAAVWSRCDSKSSRRPPKAWHPARTLIMSEAINGPDLGAEVRMPEPDRPRFFSVGRVLLVLAIVSAIAAFFLAGWHRELTLETIKERRDWLKGQVEDHLVLSAAIYF